MHRPEDLIQRSSDVRMPITPRVARTLLRRAGLAEFYRHNRGRDPELDATLDALQMVANSAAPGEPAATVGALSTAQAATRIGITDRAVRLAISEKRLNAVQVGGNWAIAPEDADDYRKRYRT